MRPRSLSLLDDLILELQHRIITHGDDDGTLAHWIDMLMDIYTETDQTTPNGANTALLGQKRG